MVTRRQYLATTGVALSGTAVVSSATAAEYEGMVVFTYDDGPIEDYTETFQVHQEHDAPACSAVCPGLMEDSDDFLDPKHVTEMDEFGWEFMSHTLKHRSLGHIYVERDLTEGDDRLYVDHHRHGRYSGDPVVIFDDQRKVTATTSGRGTDDYGQYIELENPVEKSINATNGLVRHTEEFIRHILEESKSRIEEWSAPVTGFVYPFGRSDGIASDLVPEYYDSVPNFQSRNGLNPIDGLEPTRIVRKYIETDKTSLDEIDQFMAAVERNALGVVGGHSQYDALPPDWIDRTLELAAEHDLRVVTMQEALSELGVLDGNGGGNGTPGEGNGNGNASPDEGDENKPVITHPNDADDKAENTSPGEGTRNETANTDSEDNDKIPGFGIASGVATTVGSMTLVKRWLDSSADEET
ncbi:polysaccharide deacetylase family protein [Natrinema sp. 74]|uniref:polysaccharide deacetylase family protein n=1 Tax=Natrinema sp. 74 TaxID=3384159 RepID=UPI0038D4C06E